MTVNTTSITSGPYLGNDIADEFSYTFRVEDKIQLTVYETDDSDVETILTVDTDYTVAGIGDDAGGLVTRVAGALPTGYEWYIRSNYEETQKTAFASQGGFFPDVHEAAMDKLTFLIQQSLEELDRCLKVTVTSGLDPDNIVEDLYDARDEAEASAAAALVSENNAATSESNAATSETNAEASYQAALLVEADVTAEGVAQVALVEAEGDDQVARIQGISDFITNYDNTFDYTALLSYTIGSDGIMYQAIVANGPSSSIVDPVGDSTGTWLFAQRGLIGQSFKLEYEPSATQLIQMGGLERDGSNLLDADYPELLAVWGSKLYGNADGTHFYLSDDRGKFERIWDHGASIDPNAASRTDRGDTTTGDHVGTQQADGLESHQHTSPMGATGNSPALAGRGTSQLDNLSTSNTGGDETRPINIYKFGGIFVK